MSSSPNLAPPRLGPDVSRPYFARLLVVFTVIGVGHCAAALGSIRSPLLPAWFGPPLVPSVPRGVDQFDVCEFRSMV